MNRNSTEMVTLNTTKFISLQDIINVARHQQKVFVEDSVWDKLKQAHDIVQAQVNNPDTDIYGVNTGLGSQKEVRFTVEDLADYNQSLIYDHATAVGEEVAEDLVRGTIFFRLAALANGGSGISPETFQGLVEVLNAGIIPSVQRWGSVGQADLAPLSQISLTLIGAGKAKYKGKLMTGEEALEAAELNPIELQPRDGLALIGANSFSSAIASLAIWDGERLIDWSETAVALSWIAYQANNNALRVDVVEKFSKEAAEVAENILTKIAKTEFSARSIQDPLSFRCVPQVHGTFRKVITDTEKAVLQQISSPLDNPLLHVTNAELISNGNFDATDLVIELDRLRNILYRVIVLHERRVGKLLMNYFSGYPSGLAKKEGYVGLDVIHHTMLSLLGEATSLAQITPVQIGLAAEGVEDYGTLAAKSAQSLAELIRIWQIAVSIELIVATQALTFRDRNISGPLLQIFEKIKEITENEQTPSNMVDEVYKFIGKTNDPFVKESENHDPV